MTKRQKISALLLSIMTPVLIAVWVIPKVTDSAAISSIGGDSLSITNAPLPPYYLQNDPRWKDDKIGGSSEKIECVGCTLCCVSMSLSQQGYPINPKDLNTKLISTNGFTGRGWLKWKSVSDLFVNKITILIPRKPSHKVIDKALRSNRPVIAKIMLKGSIPHWVLIVGKLDNDYLIMNPLDWNRSLRTLSEKSDEIYSIRIIKGNEIAH